MRFIYIYIFLIFSTIKAETSENNSACEGAASDIEGQVSSIDYLMSLDEEGDELLLRLEQHEKRIQKTVEKCNLISPRISPKGYNGKFKTIKNKIEYFSKFRDVSSEIERYKKYASKLKINSNEINEYSEKYFALGRKASVDQQKKCQPDVDLRSESLLGTPRNQTNSNWCYAFTSADLLSYKLKKKVSALDLAIKYKDNLVDDITKLFGFKEYEWPGAYVGPLTPSVLGRIIERAQKNGGVCLEKDLPSEDDYSMLEDNLKSIYKHSTEAATYCTFCMSYVAPIFPKMQEGQFKEIMSHASKGSLIKELNDNLCKERIDLKNIKVKRTGIVLPFDADKSHLFEDIDVQLENKNILLLNYKNFLQNINNEDGTGHISSIVGRKYNNLSGECEYLIRDSWSTNCNQYDKRLKCEQGNIWVPKSILNKNMQSVEYLE